MPAPAKPISVLITLSLLVCSHAALASEAKSFDYHGWHVDASRVKGAPRDALEAAVRKQIDGIETLGIAQDIISFMRTVPLHAQSSRAGEAPAHYEQAKGVEFRVDALEPTKPVLIHELLRAFHEKKLGYDNPAIVEAYQQARTSGKWPADAPMLKNVQDFFAATATVYLFGSIDTAPFSQGRLHEAQPNYFKWLGEVFDGFRGCEGVQP